MGEPNLIGDGGDEFVAPGGEFGGDAAVSGGKAGKKEETTLGQRFFPVRRKAEVADRKLVLGRPQVLGAARVKVLAALTGAEPLNTTTLETSVKSED